MRICLIWLSGEGGGRGGGVVGEGGEMCVCVCGGFL